MKAITMFMLALLVPALSFGQTTTVGSGDASQQQDPQLSTSSPFYHLGADEGLSKTSAAPPPFQCPSYFYYQNSASASFTYHTQDVPTSDWAVKITLPPPPPGQPALVCTVWTVSLDFELLNASLTDKDTIKIFVREAFSPYADVFNTWFIARAGVNQGNFEIDPPVVPPYGVRAIMNVTNSRREFLMGFRIIGDSSHQVKFKFTTPSLYTTTPRSFKFSTRTSLLPAGTAIGTSADMVFGTRVCCDYPIPVELSTFSAYVDGEAVQLFWRTETETNNYQFEVQRARGPEGPWESRGYLPGHGSTTMPQEYRYRDPFTLADFGAGEAPVYWYRLRQSDFDGSTSEFPPMQVLMADIASSGFELSPAYPNPMSLSLHDRLSVRYRVAEESAVRITVHDMLGRELAVLSDHLHPAGVFETSWFPDRSLAGLNSGQYFIRMQAGAFNGVQKVSLVR